ncbi:lactosylceramide 4-alpha-galactosyltransferase isoform X2 [Colius striatus]|uniref:lactosylceramide 4-alpha-galactosyltransferase isoform X2 n=1 Tax=Colius striatus TaxID=57412 RepID=UPI002B1D32DC|nr:lactosylceramide 4-alpha-galactosyltransferase isoform X2 [Colius striatus]XP_061864209.1 lactosylceramide 4-alpha-galactosyltransferase isoform X2 [Colius striatus]XP_061864218.1 lactosylceramide 4-alpha-galactosyltransferase isoform X2 [Colius striatus]XP_061864225.1 lactosylceramide 4-alpha-galactosyltransferase isoform X2 [Colius striatus]XP_061864233.1 lactosylceramide 4-alpha-galactosyltransferase isoform X2 [Colius striatus]XP_061864241.1 lactosylceramide 4-alpha-galactosyltransferas
MIYRIQPAGVWREGETDHNSCLERACSDEARLTRMSNCLPKLTTAVMSHKIRVLFILTISFVSIISVLFYWKTGQDIEGQLYSLPRQNRCAQLLPHLAHATAGGTPPSSGDVFFVETSERTNPSYLFMCSVESAARMHPETRIVVLMKGLANGNASLPNHWAFFLLNCFPNVEFQTLNLTELFSGTPLAKWFLQAQQRWEPYFLPVLSDACRIAIMWKFGGIYLDTDFIVLKNLKNLTNALGMQSQNVLNGAFLSFEPKHEFMELCLQDFVDNYNGWIWAHQGPQLLTRVFKKWCSISEIQNGMNCKGVSALAPEAMYPVPWEDWKKLFEAISSLELQKLLKNTYAVHVWNKLSHGTRLEITSQALLAQLYSQFCPATYTRMKNDYKEKSGHTM